MLLDLVDKEVLPVRSALGANWEGIVIENAIILRGDEPRRASTGPATAPRSTSVLA
jgi:hypothetical protein